MTVNHVADPHGIDVDAGTMIATCRTCGKRLFRPKVGIEDPYSLPALGPWTHRTERYHHPVRKPTPQIPGQGDLFASHDE